jgi:pimeloyl-ACP methyl ester carboxylesterase
MQGEADVVDDCALVPPGHYVDTPTGRIFYREAGRPDAPVLVLLHGWVGTAGTNWYFAYPELAPHFRVIAPDLRGHGRGPRSIARFRLTDCADDVGRLLEALDLRDVVLVGFSMGGPVAQLTWRAHRDRVAGLVMCATSYQFVSSSVVRLAVTSLVPAVARATRVADLTNRLPVVGFRMLPAVLQSERSLAAFGGREMRRHDVRHIVEAGWAIGSYDAGDWISEIDVPTSVVLTTKDRAVGPVAQLRLASRIKGATVHAVGEGHLGVTRPALAEALATACLEVVSRAGLLRGDELQHQRDRDRGEAHDVVTQDRPREDALH